jgi:hypothetical protein
MSRRVRGVINLMYFRYEKFKKWITRPPLSRPAGKSGVVLKIDKAARIIYKNDLPIGAAVALNEGVSMGLHLEELIARGLDPRSAVGQLRGRKRC